MKRTIITLTLVLVLALSCVAMAEEVPGTLPTDGTDAVEAIPTDNVNDAASNTAPTDDLKAAMDAYRAAKQDKALDDLEEELDGYVEEGSLTQEQADLILNSVKERIAAKNGECPSCGYKFDKKGKSKLFPGMQGGRSGKQNGMQHDCQQMPGMRGQMGGCQQMMPQDDQRPDAQSGATPRNNGRTDGKLQFSGNQMRPGMNGGQNQMPGNQQQYPDRQNGNQMSPGMAPQM